jgi:hypothetical protein
LKRIRIELATGRVEGNRQWFVNRQGQTMVVLRGSVGAMAPSADDIVGTSDVESAKESVERTFALSATEVTVEQFQRFYSATSHAWQLPDRSEYAATPGCPQNAVNWYLAAEYCNWLSRREGLEDDQLCYAPNDSGSFTSGMKIVGDFLDRTGYRLPTEQEWEYCCRAGSSATRSFGECEELIEGYAWYVRNARDRAWPVASLKPNELGLFDMYGNVWEWCQPQEPLLGQRTGGLRRQAGYLIVDGKTIIGFRGGAFVDRSKAISTSFRKSYKPADYDYYGGFRVAKSMPGPG